MTSTTKNYAVISLGVVVLITVVCGTSDAQDVHPSSWATEGRPLFGPPPAPEPEPEPSPVFADPKPRDMRPLGVFGVAVAVQAVGLVLTLPMAVAGGFTDRSVEIAYAIYLGVAPAVGVGMGSLLARTSSHYDVPVGSMFVGGYLGAAVAYGLVVLFREHDDPKVDGSYDGNYFHEDSGGDVAAGFFTLGLASVLLPAAGIAIGCAAGRKRKTTSKKVSLGAPSLAVFSPVRKGDPGGYGMTVLRGTF